MKIYKIAKTVIEIDSDLFQGSGCNASTDDNTINHYIEDMKKYNGWGKFPPAKGSVSVISQSEFEDYKDAQNGGYEDELDYSRDLNYLDIGRSIARISDGHNRAYAAKRLGFFIKLLLER